MIVTRCQANHTYKCFYVDERGDLVDGKGMAVGVVFTPEFLDVHCELVGSA